MGKSNHRQLNLNQITVRETDKRKLVDPDLLERDIIEPGPKSLIQELQVLRKQYLKNGGADATLLKDMSRLEIEANEVAVLDGSDPKIKIASAVENS
ncbi:hypothetical protein HK096_009657, partial [Nowakowskiella sp. JEL0078]